MEISEAEKPRRRGIERRRERQRREARRAILDATETLLIESGLPDFSIRDLASRSGYSAPTVYHHFGDKDGLISALLEERVAGLDAELGRVELGDDALVNLRSIALAFVGFAASNPTFIRLMWTASRDGENRMNPTLERIQDRVGDPIRELTQARRLGSFDHESAGHVLWAMLRGLISLQVTAPTHPWTPNLAERAVDALLSGMTLRAPGDEVPR